jgi:hypothetical protein
MLIDDIERLIRETPGLTATELAYRLFGINEGYSQRINTECRALAHLGRIERRGSGGPGDPYRYYPIQKGPAPFNSKGATRHGMGPVPGGA